MTVAVPETPAAPPASNGYAGLATRTLALAADAVVINVIALLVSGVLVVAASVFGLSHDVRSFLAAAGVVLAVLWTVSYFLFFWTSNGQTPGALVMRMRVRREDADAPLGLRRAVVRLGVAFLCALPLFLPYLLILLDPRRRGLHDKAARSVVVYTPRERRRR